MKGEASMLKKSVFVTVILSCLVFGLSGYSAAIEDTTASGNPLDNWVVRESGTTQWLWSVAFGNNTFVAVGENGTILTSGDGHTWAPSESGTTQYLRRVAFGNNIFVVVGTSGTIITSRDGHTWTPVDSGTAEALYGLVFGNNTFVAVGDKGTTLTSTDGLTWISGSSPGDYFSAIAFGNGQFVATGTPYDLPTYLPWSILYSSDGTTWSRSLSGANGMLGTVGFGHDTYLVMGTHGTRTPVLLASPDGKTWSSHYGPCVAGLLSYENAFVGVGGSGGIYTSPDGITWSQRTSPTSASLYDVVQGNDTFVAVGGNGTIIQSGVVATLVVAKPGPGAGTITSSPSVINCGGICTAYLAKGDVINLTATPGTGSTFTGWTGGGCGKASTCRVTMGGSVTISAAFALNNYTLTASKTGTGTGTISAKGLTCSGSTCTGTYPYKTVATLTATPSAGVILGGWTGCDSFTGNTCTVTVSSNKSVSVAFVSSTYTLTATKISTGTGTLSAKGLTCSGSTCTGTYPYKTTVSITATADAGSTLKEFTGCDTAYGIVCVVAMTTDRKVTASFTALRYTLTATKTGSGTGTLSAQGLACSGSTCRGTYYYNTPLTIRAVPSAGSVFAFWTGCDSESGDTCTINIKGNTAISATFIGMPTVLAVVKSGSGTVVSSPAGINCGTTCSAGFPSGTAVRLSATPDSGQAFAYWSGMCSGAASTCTLTLGGGTSVAGASFVSANTAKYRLTTARKMTNGGDGAVESVDGTINCGSTCTRLYYPQTVITLSAKPSAGSTFSGWTGACSGKSTCSVTMNNAKAVQATFTGPARLTVSKQHVTKGDGTVTSTPSGINCGETCSAPYSPGTTVTLTATPMEGSIFFGWKPASQGCTTGTCTVTVNRAGSVSAVFVGSQQLTVVKRKAAGGDGFVTSAPSGINCGSTCTGSFLYRQSVTLTASPASGSTFAGWAPQTICRGTGTCTVTMNTAKSVSATFRGKGKAAEEESR